MNAVFAFILNRASRAIILNRASRAIILNRASRAIILNRASRAIILTRAFRAIMPNRASRAIMPKAALLIAARPLVAAAAVSLALHGGILWAASWLWVPATAPPEAPALMAVAFVAEAPVPPKQRSKRVAAAAQSEDGARSRALAALDAAKRRARPAPKAIKIVKPKLAKTRAVHPRWVKAPPVPPPPPRFHLGGGPETAPRPGAKPPTGDPRADKPVAVEMPPARAAAKGAGGNTQTAKTTPSEAPDAMARPRPVAGLGNRPPQYPWIARRRGEQGRVVLEVEVTADGRAKEVRVKRSSGSARLDRAAQAAVRAWRFSPARRGGRAVAGRIDIPIAFRLTK